MGQFLMKMERKYGKYAIRNLPLYITIIYTFGFFLYMLFPQTMDLFSLNFHAIFQGQVWRLFTWILIPEGMNIFFTLISLYFYYSIGRTLERTWGSFLFNVYFFSGLILTVVGALMLFGFLEIFGQEWLVEMEQFYVYAYGECPALYGGSYIHSAIAMFFGIYYINMSIFLAFAMTYPDMQVYVFFILPIKVKVLGIIYVIIMAFSIVSNFLGGDFYIGMISLVSIGMSLMNTFLFFLIFKTRLGRRSPKQIKRQHEYKVKVKAASNVTRHKCAICGRTEKDDPDLAFRYCSKCQGNYEYCSDHLFSHEHVKRND